MFDCVGTEVRQNMLNSSLWGFPVSVGVDFMFIDDSKITYNVFAGDYTGTTFEVSEVGSTGNIIQNNTISGSIPININTPTPPKSSSDYTDLIKLADSNYNTVSHNVAYVPGYVAPESEIPGYNVFIILGVVGLVSTLLIKTKKVLRKK